MFTTIIIFILVLSLLVFVHEFGHFWVAKKFGLKPKEFGFGFPPRIFGFYKTKDKKWKIVKGKTEVNDADDTIYSVNWIPLGGFVMLGEDDDPSDNPDHFNNQSVWKRFFILSAGVSMNIILAIVLISVGLMFGLPQAIGDNIDPRANIINEKIQIIQVLKDSPAEKAGLKIGDVIKSIDGNKFFNTNDLSNYTDGKMGNELEYNILRGKDEITLKIKPEKIEKILEPGQVDFNATERAGVGVAIATIGLVKLPWHLAIFEGIKTTVFLTWAIIVAFYDLIIGLILGKGISADVAGPIGIASITGQVARMGFVYLLQFTALLSINLAVINFLPFPALDGGRVLFLIIEKIKGSPVKRELENVIHKTGFALLMFLIIFITVKDVTKYTDVFKVFWNKIF